MHKSMMWFLQIAQLSTAMSHDHRATALHFLTSKRGTGPSEGAGESAAGAAAGAVAPDSAELAVAASPSSIFYTDTAALFRRKRTEACSTSAEELSISTFRILRLQRSPASQPPSHRGVPCFLALNSASRRLQCRDGAKPPTPRLLTTQSAAAEVGGTTARDASHHYFGEKRDRRNLSHTVL